ncbi:hypothetical protein LTR37_005970 [Vermiconidia calcicola]|uniref:Uncharacterized protein n=1 Tax=Vermiconidia calcicola TaxID=1690605 RepID=A0ACC3NI74_9PEZI|nr:hypothetical protein LTR37_005970 [Vermiconidia calcicola]
MSTMETEGAKPRKPVANGTPTSPTHPPHHAEHPMGAPRFGVGIQLLRIIGFGIYFVTCCLFIHAAQLLGSPLYFFSKDWFYAYMALTKQYFGMLVTTMTQWWSPTIVRISGDKSMKGLLRQKSSSTSGTVDGMLEIELGERVVLMANHQIYTDWLYLWWISYTNNPPAHGHIYIILKESLKYIPLVGPAMMFYSFIFMARKWATDQSRLRYRLQKLNSQHSGPLSGTEGGQQLDPVWLMIFPEGTNLSGNTRASSTKYAAKAKIPDMKHMLLPRSTGLQFCLQELKDTVPYLYDCTIAYEGIPPGDYGQDIFTLRSTYFQGRPPKSVNMHWRRFRIKDLPIDDNEAFAEWTMARWREKDDLIEAFMKNGKFPADPEAVEIEGAPTEKEWKTAYINTEVRPRSPVEFLSMFVPVLAALLVGRIGAQIVDRVFGKGMSLSGHRPVRSLYFDGVNYRSTEQGEALLTPRLGGPAPDPRLPAPYEDPNGHTPACPTVLRYSHDRIMEEAPATPAGCYLLELLAELRLRIYEHVFDKILHVNIACHSECWWLNETLEGCRVIDLRHHERHVSSLLKTCRLINREATPVCFGTVWFSFELGGSKVIKWGSEVLTKMRASRHLVRHLKVVIQLASTYERIASDVRHLASLLARDLEVTIGGACMRQLPKAEREGAVQRIKEAFDKEISGRYMAVEAITLYRTIQEQKKRSLCSDGLPLWLRLRDGIGDLTEEQTQGLF